MTYLDCTFQRCQYGQRKVIIDQNGDRVHIEFSSMSSSDFLKFLSDVQLQFTNEFRIYAEKIFAEKLQNEGSYYEDYFGTNEFFGMRMSKIDDIYQKFGQWPDVHST